MSLLGSAKKVATAYNRTLASKQTKGGLSPFARLPIWQLIVDDRGTVQFVVAGGGDDLEGFGAGRVGFGRQFVFQAAQVGSTADGNDAGFCRSAG